MLTVNELFSGIGSQSAALERLGIEFKVVGIAEIDKYAIKSYEAIHGPVRNYGDISKIEKLDYADFWTYSFPCQDISVAGKQAGIEKGKTRSGLLYEVERLLQKSKECGELPKYLMLENVKNLVGKKFKAQFDEWIKRLDELGYNTYWQVLNAKNYGIPQNRERVFAISILKDNDTGYVFPEPFELKIRLKDILENEVDEKYYINNDRMNVLLKNIETSKLQEDTTDVNQIGNCVESEGNFENPQRGRVYSMNGCSPALNCCGGGGLEPKILQLGNINPSGNGMNGNVFSQDGLSPTLTTNKVEEPKILELGKINNERHSSAQNSILDTNGICTTIDTMQGGNRQPKILEPILIGGMQKNQAVKTDGISTCLTSSMGTGGGYVPMVTEPFIAASRGRNPSNPSDRTTGSPTKQRLEINQNGTSNTITTVQKDNYVLIPQATKQGYIECNIPGVADLSYPDSKTRKGRVQENGEICPTLMGGQQDICYIEKSINEVIDKKNGDIPDAWDLYNKNPINNGIAKTLSTDCGHNGTAGATAVTQNYHIRKLTPLECWRLMGFTDEQFYKAEKINSNSQLYKQAGNSIVVDVLYYLFRNLFLENKPKDLLGQMNIFDFI